MKRNTFNRCCTVIRFSRVIGKLTQLNDHRGLLVSLKDEPKHCQKIVKIQSFKRKISTADARETRFKVSFTVIFAEGANKSWIKKSATLAALLST